MSDDLREPVRHDLDAAGVLNWLGLPVIATTLDGTIVSWNRAAETLYGHAAADAVGRDIVELLVPSPFGPRATEVVESVAAGQPWSGTFVVNRADGTPVRLHAITAPVLDDAGEAIGIVGVGRDLHGQVPSERTLHDNHDVHRLALAAGRFGTWHWDMAAGTVRWDEELEAIFGLPPGGFDGTFETYRSLLHPADRQGVLDAVAAAVAAKSDYDVEHKVVWSDGTVHWLQGRGSVTLDCEGNVTGTVGCVADVTERVLRTGQAAELTASLQAGLLPQLAAPPGVTVRSRYRPGEERLLLGGDFLDVAITPAGNIAFCIGDVSGQGALAAALGAGLRAGWRALAVTGDDPVAWLGGCADLLAASHPPAELFVTMATGFVSADHRSLSLLSAGHPPPMLLGDGAPRTLALDAFPPLGLLAKEQLSPPTTVCLPDGWTLLMCTDGLFEGHAAPGASDRLGVERIEDWCARRFADHLDEQGLGEQGLDELLAYVQDANGGPIVDDIAVLVLASPAPASSAGASSAPGTAG